MRLRSGVLAVALAGVSSLATWQWASAQGGEPLPPLIGSGDIQFRPDRQQRSGIMGENFVRGKLYVRVAGRWVAAELTNDEVARLLPLER